MNISISFTAEHDEIQRLKKYLSEYKKDNINNSYDIYKISNVTISIYSTNKVLLQGSNAHAIYQELLNQNLITDKQISSCNEQKKQKASLSYFDCTNINTIGCDEVGVGDFFGGLVTVACFVDYHDVAYLKKIGVKDSKKLTDSKMQEIFPLIIKKVRYAAKYYNPSQYNSQYDKYKNAHILKTALHNAALCELTSNLNPDIKYKVIMDEYCSEHNYQQYLRTVNPSHCVTIDHFETHAESQYIAVACASIIARIYFLKQIELLNQEITAINQKILLGNNEKVFHLASMIYKKNPKLLDKLVKKHFITYNKIVGE